MTRHAASRNFHSCIYVSKVADCSFPFVSTDIIDKSELKAFFESNCSQIYFIFYENFITLESNLKQKGECSPFTYVQGLRPTKQGAYTLREEISSSVQYVYGA